MRLSIYDQFIVGVVRPSGGWSKGRPIAYIEEDDKCVPLFDLLIPNDLDDEELARYVGGKFARFRASGQTSDASDAYAIARAGEKRANHETTGRCTPARTCWRAALRADSPGRRPQPAGTDSAQSRHAPEGAGVRRSAWQASSGGGEPRS